MRYPKSILVLVSVVSLLCLDGLVGAILIPVDWHGFRKRDPVYHHDLEPRIEAAALWGPLRYSMFTNSVGFRDDRIREISVRPESESRRIVFLGDSFTEGIGLDYGQTFSGIVAEEMAAQGVEILNAGVVSYSPKLYFLKVASILNEGRLEFDELVVFIDISDVYDELVYREFDPARNPILMAKLFALWKKVKRYSYLANSVSRLTGEGREPQTFRIVETGESFRTKDFGPRKLLWPNDSKEFGQWGQYGLQLAEFNMSRLVRLCKERGINLSIAVYPSKVQLAAGDPDSLQVRFWRSFASRSDVAFLDLYPAFFGAGEPATIAREYFLKDNYHWNHQGHKLVADNILRFLSPS